MGIRGGPIKWDRGSEKRPSTCFQIISYSKRYLCPLQLLSYALKISLSIMELQWPEFLITRILNALINFDASSWKFLSYVLGPFSLPRQHILVAGCWIINDYN